MRWCTVYQKDSFFRNIFFFQVFFTEGTKPFKNQFLNRSEFIHTFFCDLYSTGKDSKITFFKALGFADFPMSINGNLCSSEAFKQHKSVTRSLLFLWPFALSSTFHAKDFVGNIL